MEIEPLEIPDILLIKPRVFQDERGYFMESFRSDIFQEKAGQIDFVQENESFSSIGVLRGLHFQKPPYSQGKLVRVIQGVVLDIAVDIRRDSTTFGKHISVELSSENKHQVWIPRGFAHGFVVLSETAVFSYKCDQYYAPKYDAGIRWDDPDLDIDWKINAKELTISKKDMNLPLFRNLK